ERQPRADLLEQFLGDGAGDGVEGSDVVAGSGARQDIEEPGDLADRQGPQLDQRLAADTNGPRPGVQAGASTLRAGHATHERVELRAGRATGGAAILAQQLVRHADPLLAVRPDLVPILPAVDDHAIAGPVEPGPAPFLVEVVPGPLEHGALG